MRLLAPLILALMLATPALAQVQQVPCPTTNPATVCFQFPNAPIVNWSWSPAITVTPGNLAAAVAKAKPGDKILVSGPPAPVILRNLSFSPPVTIASADPANRTLLNGLTLVGDVGLTFEDLNVTLLTPVNAASQVVSSTNSKNINFNRVNITGMPDPTGKCGYFGKGLAIAGGDHVIFSSGSISGLNKGYSVAGGSYFTLQDSDLHDVNTSPVDGGGDLDHLDFLRNFIHDLTPVIACGQHSDGWHMWSKNSSRPIDYVRLIGNKFRFGVGAGGSPGISFEGTPITTSTGTSPGFTNVLVDSNYMEWNNNQGISTNWTQGTFTNNILLPLKILDNPAHAPGFIERQGSKFVITGNTLKYGPSMKPYPNNTFLTAAQIAAYLK